MMTPKEAYEARKKMRQEYSAAIGSREEDKETALTDMLDRFVTAIETIAVTLEAARR